jgi:hypothetical protein
MSTSNPALRDVWIADVPGVEVDKDRRVVVVAIDKERVTIVYGQGSPGAGGYIEIRPGTGEAKRFRPTKPTFFREANVTTIKVDALTQKIGVCSSAMFPDFVTYMERFFAKGLPPSVELPDLAGPPALAACPDAAEQETDEKQISAAPDPETK